MTKCKLIDKRYLMSDAAGYPLRKLRIPRLREESSLVGIGIDIGVVLIAILVLSIPLLLLLSEIYQH